MLNGKPAVLFSDRNVLRSFLFEEGKWSQASYISAAGVRVYDFLPLPSDGSLRVATSCFGRSVKISSVRGGELILDASIGKGFPFPRMFFPMMFIPHVTNILFPVLLAFILSGLMLRHRVSVHSHGGETAQYASLIRRAFAQMVDGIILVAGMLPFIIGWFAMFRMFEDEAEVMMFPLVMLAGFAFAFVWAVFLLLIFSWTEGKWGLTPGKWLVGIRVVGTDLEPCGFGRALLRNFLKLVDGFFNFMVGMLIVTFTKDWQRVGDMAARTIVIRKAPVAESQMATD